MRAGKVADDPVLVTGAAGLIGSAVLRKLHDRAVPVVAVVRDRRAEACSASFPIDLESPDASMLLDAAFPRLSGIIHCAASFPAVDSGADAESCAARNLRIDANVAALARAKRVRLVYCSSVSVYGNSEPGKQVSENVQLRPDGPYALSKVAGELAVAAALNSFALLRITSPYGLPLRRRTVLGTFVERALAGKDVGYFGPGDRRQDFIHADDVAAACVAALLQVDFSGAVNICSGTETSMKVLAEMIIRLARTSSIARSVNEVDPQAGRRALFDRTLALHALGWEPSISMERGVAEIIEAMRRAGQ